MNYRDLKKLIPPKKEEGAFDTFWIIFQLLVAIVCGFGLTILFFVWIAGVW